MAGIQSSDDRKIQRVPPLLVEEEKNKNEYYPKVVSIGPYHHHRDPKLAFVEARAVDKAKTKKLYSPQAPDVLNPALVEAFKPIVLDWFVSDKGKELYHNNILEIITDIRNHYERDPSIEKYLDDDDYLAEMMLRDAAFIIVYMEICSPAPDSAMQRKGPALVGRLGKLTLGILLRDLFFLLENQIPLRVVKLLITLKYGAGKDEELLHRFMNTSIYGENRPIRKETKKRGEALHLLEAFHRLVASDCAKKPKRACFKCRWFCCCFTAAPTGGGAAPACFSCTFLCCSGDKVSDPESGPTNANGEASWIHRLVKSVGCKKLQANKKTNMKNHIKSFRSVTDLMAKGIYFRPSSTQSLKDVSFKSRFFYATLELPEWGISTYTKVFFLNLVAFELSPNNRTATEVVSYVNFMKSLIERPEDVKELRERKIFFNMLGSDEEVLHVFKDINTYGADNQRLFRHVKEQIQAHYNSRIKTWIAELIHTNFRSPWTITTFLTALALLLISAAQLYYAVYPN